MSAKVLQGDARPDRRAHSNKIMDRRIVWERGTLGRRAGCVTKTQIPAEPSLSLAAGGHALEGAIHRSSKNSGARPAHLSDILGTWY